MAKRLKFTKAFDYTHKGGRLGMTSYPAGYDGPVPDAQAEVALAKGFAEESKTKADAGTDTKTGAAGSDQASK